MAPADFVVEPFPPGHLNWLCLGHAQLAEDPLFSSLRARKEYEEALDAVAEAWTVDRQAEDVSRLPVCPPAWWPTVRTLWNGTHS